MASKKQRKKTLNKEVVTVAETYLRKVPMYLSNGQRKEVKSALIRALIEYRKDIKANAVAKIGSLPVQIMNDEKGNLQTFIRKDQVIDALSDQ